MADTSTGFGGYTTAILPDVGMTMQQFDATVAQKQQEFDFKFTDVNPQELVQLSQLTYNINGALSDQGDALRIKLVLGGALTVSEKYFLLYQGSLTPPIYRPTYGSNPNVGPTSWERDNNTWNFLDAAKINTLKEYIAWYNKASSGTGGTGGGTGGGGTGGGGTGGGGTGGGTGGGGTGGGGTGGGGTGGGGTGGGQPTYTATTNGIPASSPTNTLDPNRISGDKQELTDLIYNQLQDNFDGIKDRISYPASNYNMDLAKKLSDAIISYIDATYWQRIVAYVESRIVEHTHNLK